MGNLRGEACAVDGIRESTTTKLHRENAELCLVVSGDDGFGQWSGNFENAGSQDPWIWSVGSRRRPKRALDTCKDEQILI